MANRKPASITPTMQFFVVCRAIETSADGNVSFRDIFDEMVLPPLLEDQGVMLRFAVSAQFRGGTGQHRFWIVIRHPQGVETTTDEQAFWLASRQKAHRIDSRFDLGVGRRDLGVFTLAAVLDGRPTLEVPVTLRMAEAIRIAARPDETT